MLSVKKSSLPNGMTPPEHILAAAEDEFLSVGFAASTIEAIAKRAGSGKQTIYSYFGTKEKLFLAVITRLESKRPGVMARLSNKRTCWENLCTYTDSIVRTSNKTGYVAAFRLEASVVDSFPEFGTTLLNLYVEWSEELIQYLISQRVSGVLSIDDPKVGLRQLGTLAIEGNRLGFGCPFRTREQREAVVRRAVRLFMFGHRALPHDDNVPDNAFLLDEPLTWSELDSPSGPTRVFISQDRLDELLDIAAREFFSQGFRRGSVNKIAGLAELPKTTIYRHFGDKEGLFSAAMLHVLRRIHRRPPSVPKSESPRTSLHYLARRFLDTMLIPENRQLYRTVIIESGRFPDLALTVYLMAFSATLDATETVLTQLQTNSSYYIPSPQWSARQLLFLAICGNRFIVANEDPTKDERQEIVNNAVLVFLNGYAVDLAQFESGQFGTI